VDAILVATPNHWHALATIWGLQAGKHVFVEKPASHTVWEGRKMFEASRKYNRLVQVGTMNRSRPIVQDAIKFIRDGGIGEIYMARGLCFKARPNIGKYPTAPCSRARSTSSTSSPRSTSRPTIPRTWPRSDYNMWLGPAPLRPFNRNRFHYNWHWHWDYGNGDTGNQGPHQFDIARWGLDEHVHPVKISSGGGLFDARGSSQETPDVHTTVFTYADGKVLEFATRGIHTNDEGTQKIGNLFYGSKGWVWIDGDGKGWQSYLGRKDEKGPGGTAAAGRAATPTCPPASSTRTTRTSSTPSAPAIAPS
jgi:predicted dehydrogenase